MARVLLIHKALPDRPAKPTQWSQFDQFKTDMTSFGVTWITFEGLKLRIDVWPVVGNYEIVIDDNLGGNYMYQPSSGDPYAVNVHDLDGDRIDYAKIGAADLQTAVANELTFLQGVLPDSIFMIVTDDTAAWLSSHGFTPIGGTV